MGVPINWEPSKPDPAERPNRPASLRLVPADTSTPPKVAPATPNPDRTSGETVVPAPTALTPEQLNAIRDGRSRAKKIRRAAGVATFGGWSAGIMAALSLPLAFFSVEAAVMCGVLAVVSYNELAGAKGLKSFDEKACLRLGINQLFLGVALIGYALYKLYVGLTAPSILSKVASGDPQVDAMMADMTVGLERTVNIAVWGTLAAFGLIVPGLTALYYFSRQALVRRFVTTTPAWVRDVIART